MRRDAFRNVSVQIENMREALSFERKVLRSADGRAGMFDGSTRRSHGLSGDSSGELRLEPTHALRKEVLEMRISHEPNQSPEPTAMLVTPRAEPRVAPSTAVAHL
jgi:hypothetical protein